MAKIPRVNAVPFASTASAGQIGQFGSLAAIGSPGTATTDPAVVQALSQWLAGWYTAVVSGNSPAIQDMNGFCFVVMYLLCYNQQAGVPEWNTDTPYYIGSLVNSAGVLYVSLTDNNLGNALSSAANWTLYSTNVSRTVTGTDTATVLDSFLRCNATSASFVENLPAVAAAPSGFELTIKNVATNGNTVTVTGSGAELLDLANTFVLGSMDSIKVKNNGVSWDII